MQARFSPPSSLAAHHRRLMASCADSGCPQVRQWSGATLSARTVGESLCMSKSVEAHLQGPDSGRQGPTNRMSAEMFSGSPHSTRATASGRTERQVTSKPADEAIRRERLTMRRQAFDSRPTSGRLEVDEQEMLSYQCQSRTGGAAMDLRLDWSPFWWPMLTARRRSTSTRSVLASRKTCGSTRITALWS
jgi:hypothetical protein